MFYLAAHSLSIVWMLRLLEHFFQPFVVKVPLQAADMVDEEDTIIIEGEELIRDVPAPYVYPYTGIIYKNDKDVFKVIKRIREAYSRDQAKKKVK